MSLRQKLVFVSKPHVTKINYDEALAQVVPQSKRNRLTSESIRSEIKPFLRNCSMSDEDLIFAVGQAADTHRAYKLHRQRNKGGRVNFLENNVSKKSDEKVNVKYLKPENDLLEKLLKVLQTQLYPSG